MNNLSNGRKFLNDRLTLGKEGNVKLWCCNWRGIGW